MPIASFGQEKTQVIQDQSKAWPELLLDQPEGLENSPKDPDHTTTHSRSQEEGQDKDCATSPCPAQRAEGHVPSPHMAIPGPTTPTRPPAHRASPSLRLQRHSTLRLPRTTLRLMTDTTHSRNTPVITRVSHPLPQGHQHLPGLAGKASHPQLRASTDH